VKGLQILKQARPPKGEKDPQDWLIARRLVSRSPFFVDPEIYSQDRAGLFQLATKDEKTRFRVGKKKLEPG